MTQPTTRWVLGHKVTPYFTTGDYDLALGETPPKVQGPPPHLHSNYKESFLIVEGEMDFIVNGKVLKVVAGESVDLPPNTIHTFSNNGDQTCKWVNIHSPKGFREFFEEVGVPVGETDSLQRSVAPELIQKVIQTAANYDMHIKV
ncbi:MAG: cupin domain-containing protein [Eudoraea sp.]|nr:cupin domain-containing protein [Eudoraea sp.]